MTDVVFISPYVKGIVESPSYGLLWMSAYLQKRGYSVAYLEGNLCSSPFEVAERTERLDPRIIGISATTLSYVKNVGLSMVIVSVGSVSTGANEKRVCCSCQKQGCRCGNFRSETGTFI